MSLSFSTYKSLKISKREFTNSWIKKDLNLIQFEFSLSISILSVFYLKSDIFKVINLLASFLKINVQG